MPNAKSQLKNWQKAKLGDFVVFNYGKGLPERDRVAGPYPVYGSAGVVDTNKDYLVEGPGIVVGRKGSVGETYYTNKNYFPIDTVYYITKGEKYNLRFLYYLLKTINFKSLNSDAAVPGLNRNTAYAQEVLLPKTETQEQIADVLSTYDDLIENNTRRIKILEEIAQAIYKEWFVYFRFPGHERVKMIDSKTEFGKVPEGWRIGKLSDLTIVTMGQSPSSDFYNESKEGLPFHQGVTNFGFRFPTTITYSTKGTRRAGTGDVLFSVRAPVGRINMADRDMIIGRGLASMKSISGHQSFLLYQLKHLFQTEDLIGGGAIFASVTKDDLNNFSSLIPNADIIEEFERLVRPIDELIFNITSRLSMSKKSRDLLLPKLITGEIGIKIS